MPTKTYPAIRIKQTEEGSKIILFAANACEISEWGGIPQKRELDKSETIGFQRTLNPARENSLRQFYDNQKNISQNPLLCSSQNTISNSVKFTADKVEGAFETGSVIIETEDFDSLSMLEVLKRVEKALSARLPELAEEELPVNLISDLKQHIDEIEEEEEEDVEPDVENDEDEDEDAGSSILIEETHILEFYFDIVARISIIAELGKWDQDEIVGFTKDALLSYIKPVIVVDGQHRLAGARLSAMRLLDDEENIKLIEDRISDGESSEIVRKDLMLQNSRTLPISLLETDDPAEHVFQFVIVNQKATPIPGALLGTIVSTTLTQAEHERVNDRLQDANIFVEESRHVAFLTRDQGSPFFECVERGLSSDKNTKLPFNVMLNLVKIFRNLTGGKLYEDKPTDWTKQWKDELLEDSKIVAKYEERGYETAYEYWQSDVSIWRDVFICFWRNVRVELGATDLDSHAQWGNTRKSNLFNKVYLNILLADFFQYLCETEKTIDSVKNIDTLVKDWLKRAKNSYFDRDWDIKNIKKDIPGIRKRWSSEWIKYRKSNSSAPAVKVMSRKLD